MMSKIKYCLVLTVLCTSVHSATASRDFLLTYCKFDTTTTPTFADSICVMLNAIRMQPQAVAQSYAQSWYYSSTDTNDQSLLRTLQNMKPISTALTVDTLLSSMARCHALSSGHEGHVGHDRITACTEDFDAECINYGLHGALLILMEFLEDHGVEDLAHRRILLSPEYHRIGAAHTPHLAYRYGTVIDLGR